MTSSPADRGRPLACGSSCALQAVAPSSIAAEPGGPLWKASTAATVLLGASARDAAVQGPWWPASASRTPRLITVRERHRQGNGRSRAPPDRPPRPRDPVVAVNCAAMPEQLLESELFGHSKGGLPRRPRARQGLLVQSAPARLLLYEFRAKRRCRMLPAAPRPARAHGCARRRQRRGEFDARLVTGPNRDLESMGEYGNPSAPTCSTTRRHPLRAAAPAQPGRRRSPLRTLPRWRGGPSVKRRHGIGPEAAQKLFGLPWPGKRAIAKLHRGAIGWPATTSAPRGSPAKVRRLPATSGAVWRPRIRKRCWAAG